MVAYLFFYKESCVNVENKEKHKDAKNSNFENKVHLKRRW
jgi:hypothetical protein